jgi:MFS family permease
MPNIPSAKGWLASEAARRWTVLAIASAGWVFDVYEGQLFTVFKTSMLTELIGVNPAAIDRQANIGLAAFLLGGAAGGLFFGVLGDRYGRTRILSLTILVYSMFSAVTALARSPFQVHVLRFLVAVGAGGEWAIAAALVAETFPARSRASASGTFHASSILGAALASLTGMVFARPGAWRMGFMVGLAPALLVLWVRIGLREPDHWVAARQDELASSRQSLGNLRELWAVPLWRSRALLGLALATVGLATYWGIFAWAPELVGIVLGDSVSAQERGEAGSRAYLIMNFTGGLLGLLSFAPLASWRGRRFAFAVYHVGAAIVAPVAFLCASTYTQALWLLSIMAFFVLGMHAGYAIYFPELFPTRLRATGASVCFNLGRVLGAAILIVRAMLGSALGLRWAVVVLSGLFWVGLVLLRFIPETHGRKLPE